MQHKGATGEKKTFSTPETDLRIKFYKKTKTLRENVILSNSNSFLDFYKVYICSLTTKHAVWSSTDVIMLLHKVTPKWAKSDKTLKFEHQTLNVQM